MIKFLDGHAEGQVLELRRLPMFLRVVRSRGGNWDALDQLDDEPKASETIFVYKRRDDLPISKIHVCRSPRSKSGWLVSASYSVLPEQPGDEDVRSTAAWRPWVEERPEVKTAQAAAEKRIP